MTFISGPFLLNRFIFSREEQTRSMNILRFEEKLEGPRLIEEIVELVQE